MDDGSIIVASFSGGIVLHDSLALPPLTSGSLTVGDVRVFLAYFYPTYFSLLWSVFSMMVAVRWFSFSLSCLCSS